MEVEMNDSGIDLDLRKPKDVKIDVDNLAHQASCESDSSNSNESVSSSRSDEITKIDLGKTPNGEENDQEYSPLSISPDASSDFLLNSTRKESKKGCTYGIATFIEKIKTFVTTNEKVICRILACAFIIFNAVWLVVACCKNLTRSLPYLVIICLIVFFNFYSFFKNRYGKSIVKSLTPFSKLCERFAGFGKWVALGVAIVGLVTWIVFDLIIDYRPHQIISLVGYFVFLFFLFILSKMPHRVIWRPVIWGCSIQIVLGVLILRTTVGFAIFNYLGNFVQTFLKFVEAGCIFVFGEAYKAHFFAFGVLPIIVYFSAFISIMYHLGAMQWVISKIAYLMQISLGTSATESMVAAGNIFVGQTESPLLIRPYIKDLTTSELHAVMTAGFGTIAGSVLGAYLGFGIKAIYVITACVMAAPCALAVSKLLYPETKISKFVSEDGLVLESSGHRNIIEAAFVGASQAIPLVLNIGANLIAFIALLAGVNAFLGWYGGLVDIENLSFEFLCSYLFMPISYLMGIEWADCFKCAELIGTKIFLNEFIAYEKLSKLIDNKNASMVKYNETTDDVNWITDRSEAIITYALCGFANLGSLGIMLGGLGAMCPDRQGEMAKIVLRALLGGIFVSFLNACIAGFFYYPAPIDCGKILSRPWNASELSNVYQCCSQIGNLTGYHEVCCNHSWPIGYSNIEGC